jgi:acetaldehyde dehydrogenase
MTRTKVAVIGSGNIGTDLMVKVLRLSDHLEMGAMVGIDPDSDGLRRARRMGVPITTNGVRGLLEMPNFDDIAVVFDATSATAISRMPGYWRRTARNSSTSPRQRSARSWCRP